MKPPDSEIRNRWPHAIDKRLTIDCAFTNGEKVGEIVIDEKPVEKTWRGYLENKDELLEDFHRTC